MLRVQSRGRDRCLSSRSIVFEFKQQCLASSSFESLVKTTAWSH